ncbi:unnamed protein product [Caenorhabditis angaria]|uniref:RING-CH-type domain-containing protein n=1 Tax=Caenorhabditis angaria TaxID=860376 RepID=A0A9P1I7Q5_9PELO|nr:unnamed protein product [Caenorhabditis angaria]
MHNSKSDYGFRRTCIRPAENLGTISEECRGLIENNMETPKKSATFHEFLNFDFPEPSSSSSTTLNTVSTKEKIKRLHSQPTTSTSSSSRKRSIFYEMGERIRLFSTASFVSPAVVVVPTSSQTLANSSPQNSGSKNQNAQDSIVTVVNSQSIPKSHSLSSFDGDSAVYVSARCPSQTRKPSSKNQQRIGSLLSLHSNNQQNMETDLEKCGNLEKDVSQLGILCHHCSTTDLACPKASQKELPSPSASSVYSLARSDLSNEPLCRICHCCWPPDSNDPLISPCRCSGSLQYVHVSCLMHWLDISSRKLHRPAICELCLYKYRRRRVLKYREMKLPQCANTDIRYYSIFVIAILMMMCSAFATIVCFQLEKTIKNEYVDRAMNGQAVVSFESSQATTIVAVVSESDVKPSPAAVAVPPVPGPLSTISAKKKAETTPLNSISTDHETTESLLSTITLIAAMVFFLSFFLAMYAHVKSGLSFCGYVSLCWSSNLEWSIEEYKHSRDTQYLNKLEELRRKINEKQKKAADEVEPLRSSVIVLE